MSDANDVVSNSGISHGMNMMNIEEMREEEEEERQREEQEEDRNREEAIAHRLKGAFDDIEIDDIEGESDGDDENDIMSTPGTRLPAHYLTSTPYNLANHHHDQLSHGALLDTPDSDQHQEQDDDLENRYLSATSKTSDHLEILYEARGKEIDRLRQKLGEASDHGDLATRRLQHDLALIKGEKEKLQVQEEQSHNLYEATHEENKELRCDIELLEAAKVKWEKNRNELMDREEILDQQVQTLQGQLLQLQKGETALKAREHHDNIVRSLRERHEGELQLLQQELDRQTELTKRRESEADDLRQRMSETRRHHESMLVEKSDRIDDLTTKLSDTQKRLTDLITANMGTSGQDLEDRLLAKGSDPVAEICKLKSSLAATTVQRNEYKKIISDLTDELSEVKSRLAESELRVNSGAASQKELVQLRHESNKKDRKVDELQRRERDLLQKYDMIKIDMDTLKAQVAAKSSDEALKKSVRHLECELARKEKELKEQGVKIQSLIVEWEKECEKLHARNGKDQAELDENRVKYLALKQKVRHYQNHCTKKEAQYKKEIQDIREGFGKILLNYKDKMAVAYDTKNSKVEEELSSLKRYFDDEANKVTGCDINEGDVDSITLSTTTAANAKSKHYAAKTAFHDEGNSRQSRSARNSRELARIFANATKDVSSKLKRPSNSPLTGHNKGHF